MSQTTFKSIVYPALVIIAACLVAGYFFVWPQWDKYTDAKRQLEMTKTTNQGLSQSQSTLTSFLKSYNDHQQDQAMVNLALPKETDDLAHLTSNIGDMAASSGVSLSNFSVTETNLEKTRVKNSIQVVDLDLVASGSYLAFRNFILRLESNLRLMDLTHAILREDDSGSLQYQIKFKVYYQE